MLDENPEVIEEPIDEVVTPEPEVPEEIVIGFEGDEPAPVEVETPRMKDLRKKLADAQKEARLASQRLAEIDAQRVEPEAVKPTLESMGYDEAAFETALDKWHEGKAKRDAVAKAKADAELAEKTSWQESMTTYQTRKKALPVPDFDEAEGNVMGVFTPAQQAVILKCAPEPEKLVYALGKNPEKAKTLGDIKDPVKFIWALSKLEGQMKMEKRPPPVESRLPGSTAGSFAGDATLARLEAEAEKTGNRTAVIAYKRKLREA